jgi:hypothetical protein
MINNQFIQIQQSFLNHSSIIHPSFIHHSSTIDS